MEIYNDNGDLCHIIWRKQDIQGERTDIVPEDNFLQVAALRLGDKKTFKPHQHVWNEFNGYKIAQESWVVILGQVKVDLYDTKGVLLHTDLLSPGDISITLQGGHNYTSEGISLVYEFKTGPYLGKDLDKVEL
jgi:hypothetical protein